MKIEICGRFLLLVSLGSFVLSGRIFASSLESEDNVKINTLRASAAEPVFLRLAKGLSQREDLARALIIASERDFLATVKYLIEKRNVPVNTTVLDGYTDMTALMAAVDSHCRRIVIYLVESAGAQIDHDTEIGSPLVNAAADGDVELVKYLVEKGANIERADSTHRLPLYAAIKEEQVETAITLIKMGAFFAVDLVQCSESGLMSQICNGLLGCLMSTDAKQRHICYRLYNQYSALRTIPQWYGEEEHEAFQYLVYFCNPCYAAKRKEIRSGIEVLYAHCIEQGLGKDLGNLMCTKFLVMPAQEGFQYEFDSRQIVRPRLTRSSSAPDSYVRKRQRTG